MTSGFLWLTISQDRIASALFSSDMAIRPFPLGGHTSIKRCENALGLLSRARLISQNTQLAKFAEPEFSEVRLVGGGLTPSLRSLPVDTRSLVSARHIGKTRD